MGARVCSSLDPVIGLESPRSRPAGLSERSPEHKLCLRRQQGRGRVGGGRPGPEIGTYPVGSEPGGGGYVLLSGPVLTARPPPFSAVPGALGAVVPPRSCGRANERASPCDGALGGWCIRCSRCWERRILSSRQVRFAVFAASHWVVWSPLSLVRSYARRIVHTQQHACCSRCCRCSTCFRSVGRGARGGS